MLRSVALTSTKGDAYTTEEPDVEMDDVALAEKYYNATGYVEHLANKCGSAAPTSTQGDSHSADEPDIEIDDVALAAKFYTFGVPVPTTTKELERVAKLVQAEAKLASPPSVELLASMVEEGKWVCREDPSKVWGKREWCVFMSTATTQSSEVAAKK
jgi:hypothetical protein